MTVRRFSGEDDYAAISRFLYGLYEPDNRDGNWFQPVWEYAYTHAWFHPQHLDRIGIWEDGGGIVAVASYESVLGEAFFHVGRAHAALKPEMVEWAEANLCATREDGARVLHAFVNDFDQAFTGIVADRGYTRAPDSDRPMSQMVIPRPFPPVPLAQGFRLQTLAEGNDLVKLDRCMHRGFNHPGEPPPDGVEGRRQMQSGPNFRPELNVVAVAPSGDYVAFGGMWFDPVNRFAYVEPVCTDPDYRRMGLGRAAVLDSIRRCGELGATVAYVGSKKPFYLSLGFRKLYASAAWRREWPAA